MTLARYSTDELERLISEEAGGGEFVAAYLKGVAQTLSRHPAQYRGFGPYWWPLKALLVEAGYSQFGTEIDDDDALTALTYETPALTVAAAYAFAEHAFSTGLLTSPSHTVTFTNGETGTYHVGDEEIEGILMARTVLTRGGRHGEAT
ncbi:hypothetical protein [Vreelandella alkaliphila]|uniref:Uncharacterized protein n=1 Tax=Vreelandella alkaliphila TaxID=272774 RepID=A0AAJ2RZT0_9GAMM|nr:hypothetical protein [Halomonas alkaliphila]MDX5979564.1 hypothetical protein [Halomonas alkaliphila]